MYSWELSLTNRFRFSLPINFLRENSYQYFSEITSSLNWLWQNNNLINLLDSKTKIKKKILQWREVKHSHWQQKSETTQTEKPQQKGRHKTKQTKATLKKNGIITFTWLVVTYHWVFDLAYSVYSSWGAML